MLARERVGDADRLGTEVAFGDAEAPWDTGVREAQIDQPVESDIPHHVLRPAAERLLAAMREVWGRVQGTLIQSPEARITEIVESVEL